jgi:hypothetical protein
MKTEPRPLQHLRDAERDYGRDLWRRYSALIEDVRSQGVTWPPHIHAPLAAAYAIASGGGDRRLSPERAADVGRLGALAAWRATKGVYRWDPDLLDAVWSTPLDRALPVDVLTRLPEWCVYLELSGREIEGIALHGAYVHLEADANTGRLELRMLLDSVGHRLVGAPIHLIAGGTLGDGARASALTSRAEAVAAGMHDITARTIEQHAATALERLAPIVSLVLYLCTEEPDLRADDDHDRMPTRPRGRATGAQRVTTWDTGYRIGAALRWAREHGDGESHGGAHASPVGHVRRAHWHTYWLGSEQRGDRRRELRWLAPILVGVDLPEELLAVVRTIKLSRTDT